MKRDGIPEWAEHMGYQVLPMWFQEMPWGHRTDWRPDQKQLFADRQESVSDNPALTMIYAHLCRIARNSVARAGPRHEGAKVICRGLIRLLRFLIPPSNTCPATSSEPVMAVWARFATHQRSVAACQPPISHWLHTPPAGCTLPPGSSIDR